MESCKLAFTDYKMASSAEKQSRINSLLNRKRKVETGCQPGADPSPSSSSAANGNPEENSTAKLTAMEEEKKKATELILREAKMAKERADLVGPQGWIRPKSLNTNKQFLHRTLAATLPDRKPKKQKTSREQQ
ncbi:hypothetical protein GCK32_002603 [Trichostrongylus colubriformis]|uniref:Uncharacterized protein n=1 Tax=Trichostrongylus colubriformis TaxID=6319 RepID=A0AAN8IBE5_TRICO